jgi:hypothetical protein
LNNVEDLLAARIVKVSLHHIPFVRNKHIFRLQQEGLPAALLLATNKFRCLVEPMVENVWWVSIGTEFPTLRKLIEDSKSTNGRLTLILLIFG